MKKTKGKKSQAFKKKWQPRLCRLFKCKKPFDPKSDNQGFHVGECRIRAFWIKREGGVDAQRQLAWEAELKRKELGLAEAANKRALTRLKTLVGNA